MRAAFVLYFAMLCAALLAALPLATLSAATRFEKMDRDGDGKLDRVEFARW